MWLETRAPHFRQKNIIILVTQLAACNNSVIYSITCSLIKIDSTSNRKMAKYTCKRFYSKKQFLFLKAICIHSKKWLPCLFFYYLRIKMNTLAFWLNRKKGKKKKLKHLFTSKIKTVFIQLSLPFSWKKNTNIFKK